MSEFKIVGFEVLEKRVSRDLRSSGSVYLPKRWAGKKVIVVRVEE